MKICTYILNYTHSIKRDRIIPKYDMNNIKLASEWYNVCLEKGSDQLFVYIEIDRYGKSVTICWSDPFSRDGRYFNFTNLLWYKHNFYNSPFKSHIDPGE